MQISENEKKLRQYDVSLTAQVVDEAEVRVYAFTEDEASDQAGYLYAEDCPVGDVCSVDVDSVIDITEDDTATCARLWGTEGFQEEWIVAADSDTILFVDGTTVGVGKDQ